MLERLLIVGLGSIGSRHARIARELVPQVSIAAWRSRRHDGPLPEGVDQCVTSLDEALAFGPTAAVISSPATRHLDAAMPLAEAGVHLLVEKPIASSATGVQELIDACRRTRVTLMTGYNLRFLPSLAFFGAQLDERRIGRVLSVRAEVGQFLPSWRPGTDYRLGVSARAELGGGALLELSHEIDYLGWLFGEVDWVSAVLRRQSNLEIDVEDTAHLTLGFAPAQQAPGVVAQLNMDIVRHDTTRTCTVIGELGTLRWDAVGGRVDVLAAGSTAWETLFARPSARDESYLNEWCHFLDCITTGSRPIVSGAEGLAAIRVVDAARKSAATDGVVRLERSAPAAEALERA